MRIDLGGRSALVCGASAGIGYAVAQSLSAAGANVMICSRNEKTLTAAATSLMSGKTQEVIPVVADMTRVEDIDALTSAALEHFGTVDILVNNTGGPPPGNFDDLDEQAWREAVNLTLLSAIETTRRVLPAMRQQGWGRIVNVTSTSVKQPVEGLLLSNSIRMAVVGWAKSLANEVGPDGVLVNNVCPGYMATERLDQLAASLAIKEAITEAEIRARWAAKAPLRRIGDPVELAQLVVFLASDEASYITGTTIAVDGGRNQMVT